MELPQCMCFLDRKKCVNLLASLHNKFTCVDRTGDVEWPSPMARWGLKTGRTTIRKPALLALYVRYGIECGRFFFVFLDFGQISPPAIFGQPWPATGGEGGSNPPSRG